MTKPNLGRGRFYCGEMTHVRRDCPRLKWEGSKVSSPKRAGSVAVRVVETRDAAPEGSAGVTAPDATSELKCKIGCYSWRVESKFQPW